MDVVSSLPAPLAAMSVISASPSPPVRNPRPSSSSGSAHQRGPRQGAGEGGARGDGGAGSGGSQAPAGQGAAIAATAQHRKASGRSGVSAAAAAGAVAEAAGAVTAAASPAGESAGDRRRSSTSSLASTPPSSARKVPLAAPGGGGGTAAAAASPRAVASQVRGAPLRQEAADAPPLRRPLTRTGSDEARTEGSLSSKPPLPSHALAAAGRGTADPPAVLSAGDALRPLLKRSSSSNSINALTVDVRSPGDGVSDAPDGAAVRPEAPAAHTAAVAGVRERRVSSGHVAASRGGAAASAAVAEKLAFRTPRESSCSGASKDSPSAATALLPFRPPSGTQQPPSPDDSTSPQERTSKPQQHSSQSGPQQQQQSVRQQQQQQPASNRAVRFTRGGSTSSNLGSPTPTAAALVPTPYRRVSDSSSHLSFSPAGGRDPPPRLPPPPSLLIHRRPSDDGLVASAVATAAAAAASAGPPSGSHGARRDRPARSGISDAGGPPPLGANVMWARSQGQTDGSGAGPGSEPTSARGAKDTSKRATVDVAATPPSPTGSGRASASGVGNSKRSGGGGRAGAASAAGGGGGGGGIRRAAELGPMSMPGGLDGGLREAMARAAVANVAQLTGGSLLPERDFGYARVLDEHQRKQQRLEQQQQQQQQQKQHPQQHESQQQSAVQPAEPSSRRSSMQVDPEGATAAAAAATATGTATTPAVSPRNATAGARVARPPLAARSMRSVLKSTASPASNGAAAAAALNTTSYRFLSLRRPSSKAYAPDLDPDNVLSPASTAAGGVASAARSSAWSSVFGSAASTGSGREAAAAAAADADPMGLRTAENVEIRIHCLTFNMGGIVPAAAALPESLFSGSYLPHDAAADAAHLYVFATQESGPLADWEAAVASHLGRRYTRVAAESLMSIHILLFAVRSMAPYITDVRTSSVATGVGNVLGNKGGVAVTFSLLGARVLLVGAHFAAHDQNIERRNADFHRICAGLFAPPSTDGTQPAAAAAATTTTTTTRSAQGTPERTRDGGAAAADATGSGKLAADSASSGAAAAASSPAVLNHNGSSTPQRRPPLGPTLSRFSRSGAPSVGGTSMSGESEGGGTAAAAGGGGADASGGGDGAPVRTLTRALSTSSVSSMASNVSHAPEGSLRTRMQSFLGGVSFNTAQRHSTALLAHFDVVLWMGDLNYRIAGTPEVVKYAIDENMMEVLRANDQLQKQQKKGKVLQGFLEMPLAFAPTFKFARGTDDYDMRRSPSWTDRVLYLVNADPMFADLRPLYYMSVPELRTSDHKPVIAGFELSISPQHAGESRHARQRGCIIS